MPGRLASLHVNVHVIFFLKVKKMHEINIGNRDVAQLVEHRTGTPPTQVRFPSAARDFSPGVTADSPIACIDICAHVKDPVVYVRVRWTMETLNHPACTLGLVVRLCRSWLSPGEGNPKFPREKSHLDNTAVKSI